MRILISGAGIAGPTLAYWLLQYGHEPVIVERAPVFREGGYMIDFWGPGYQVAERMGLMPRLREVGYKIDELKFVGRNGNIRSSLNANTIYQSVKNRFISLPRGDLAKAIFDSVADKIEVIFGDSIENLQEDTIGVKVTFQNASVRRFDLIIGCDGLHSTVRSTIFGPEDRFEKYLGYYVASFITDRYSRRDTKKYVSFTAPGCQISRYALRGDRTAFLFVFTRDEKFAGEISTEKARAILLQRFRSTAWIETPEILARLEDATEIYFDSVSQIRMPRWSKGRVALVGDAAYCPSLLAGEGASFAMAGAYILAGEVERADGVSANAFQDYENRCRDFIEAKQKSAESFAGSFTPRTRFGILVRDVVLRLSALPFVTDWLMRRFITDDFELPDYATSESVVA